MRAGASRRRSNLLRGRRYLPPTKGCGETPGHAPARRHSGSRSARWPGLSDTDSLAQDRKWGDRGRGQRRRVLRQAFPAWRHCEERYGVHLVFPKRNGLQVDVSTPESTIDADERGVTDLAAIG